MSNVKKMVVCVYGGTPGDWVGGGALYGASTSEHASNSRYWLPLRLEREPYALFWATNVPAQIAKRVEAQGISGEQYYDDGYKGLDAIAPYLDKEPFYESPEEWGKKKDESGDLRRRRSRRGAKRRSRRSRRALRRR